VVAVVTPQIIVFGPFMLALTLTLLVMALYDLGKRCLFRVLRRRNKARLEGALERTYGGRR